MFYFQSYLGEDDVHYDEHIFQIGFFNHLKPKSWFSRCFQKRWAPTSYKWGHNPYQWPKKKRVTGVISLHL